VHAEALLRRRATGAGRLGVAFRWQFAVYGHDHRVYGCVTNCVTITTDAHGLQWILRDV